MIFAIDRNINAKRLTQFSLNVRNFQTVQHVIHVKRACEKILHLNIMKIVNAFVDE